MNGSALDAIDFNRYLSILKSLVPAAETIRVVDGAGRTLAATEAPAEARTRSGPPADSNRYLFEIRDQDVTLVSLMIDIPRALDRAAADAVDSPRDKVQAVLDCLHAELRLTSELDAMAAELAGRYEELNLVYSSNDESLEQENEDRALKMLVDNCVEFLDAGLVVLFYGKERAYRAVNEVDPLPDTDRLVDCLERNLVPLIESTGNTLVVNHAKDPLRDRICPGMQYKLLACPVKNAMGSVVAVLASLERAEATDFFNSDRNLLEAMARKVSKIDQANYDPMTGLMKRQRFENILKLLLQNAHSLEDEHSVMQFDLEQLQVINDLHGRETGDAVIGWVAAGIKSLLRRSNVIAYFGRGKYGVLLRHTGEQQALQAADQIRKTLSAEGYVCNGKVVQINLSAGVTVMDRQSRSVAAVMDAVELAVGTAKEKGGNRTRVYRPNDQDFKVRKEEMRSVNRIQEALRGDLFRLYCQPIVASSGNEPAVHCEVLLRLSGEDGTPLAPGAFLPAAERYYLMPLIDQWVIDATFSTVAHTGLSTRFESGLISINLSGQSLSEERLADYIDERLVFHGLSSSWFCFEITETTALGSLNAARNVVSGMRKRGFRFSLDDFGTGLSSFAYLKEFPVDYLKIDGSFVRGILDDEVSCAMVESINQIGHVMHLKTIAEFVENAELAACLKSIGVDYLQGYGIARPLPFEDYIRSLMSGDVAASA